jgi:hypothetical protein
MSGLLVELEIMLQVMAMASFDTPSQHLGSLSKTMRGVVRDDQFKKYAVNC